MSDSTQDLVIFRHFAAPPERVYRAFVDPDTLGLWFGPHGWHVPRETVSVDATVGGYQRLTMVNDEDPELTSAVDATFSEVIDNTLLVGHMDVAGMDGTADGTARLTVSFTFTEEGNGTQLEIVQGPLTAQMISDGRQGWEQSFEKLDQVLRHEEEAL